MKEGPIIFSAPMIREILEGRKTQTRRLLLPVPPDWIREFGFSALTPHGQIEGRGYWKGVPGDGEGPASKFFVCRYGMSGDRLWVKETWRCDTAWDRHPPSQISTGAKVWYEASTTQTGRLGTDRLGKLRPSIFMTRWASRITLEITEIRVQRLQEISPSDAEAEGIECVGGHDVPLYGPTHEIDPCDAFGVLWDSINAERAPWASNPWVWAISFQRLP